MKTLRYSTQYKKDFKRYRNNTSKLEKLLEVFRMLENEMNCQLNTGLTCLKVIILAAWSAT